MPASINHLLFSIPKKKISTFPFFSDKNYSISRSEKNLFKVYLTKNINQPSSMNLLVHLSLLAPSCLLFLLFLQY